MSVYRSHAIMNCYSTMWSSGFANNKGTDQTAHLRSLIRAFAIGKYYILTCYVLSVSAYAITHFLTKRILDSNFDPLYKQCKTV